GRHRSLSGHDLAVSRLRASVLVATLAVLSSGCDDSGRNKAGGQRAEAPVVLTLANIDPDPTNYDTPDFIPAVNELCRARSATSTAPSSIPPPSTPGTRTGAIPHRQRRPLAESHDDRDE